jgi:hypothetical protein
MGRYLTRRYVAVDWAEAVRLARLDQTPLDEIRHSAEAELIHRTEWWAWWSDYQLTTAIALPDSLQLRGLSPDAVELIDQVYFSDCPQPQCGWQMLAQVQCVLACERLSTGAPRGLFRPETWEQLTVVGEDEHQRVLHRFWVGYDGGYWCDIRLGTVTLNNF